MRLVIVHCVSGAAHSADACFAVCATASAKRERVAGMTWAMRFLEVPAARYRLGRETAESLRDLGVSLVADGVDAAVPLASVDDLTLAEVGPVFERLCDSLGCPLPTFDHAVEIVITAQLRDIASGHIAPHAGLEQLMNDVVRPHVNQETAAGQYQYVGESRGLEHLIGVHWGYDEIRERPGEISVDGQYGEDAIALLNEQVVTLARDWLREHPSQT
jgi:hypothetical protein